MVPVRRIARVLAMAVFICAAGASVAAAHVRSESFSRVYVDGADARIVYTVLASEVAKLATSPETARQSAADILRGHLAAAVHVRSKARSCARVGPVVPLTSRGGYLRFEQRFRCAAGAPTEMRLDAFFDVYPAHFHIAQVRIADLEVGRARRGAAARETLLTSARRVVDLTGGAEENAGEQNPGAAGNARLSVRDFFVIGFEHIVFGYDHLLFIVVLMISATSTRALLLSLTGFTVGHAISITASISGWFAGEDRVIETLIAYTILAAAAGVLARSPCGVERRAKESEPVFRSIRRDHPKPVLSGIADKRPSFNKGVFAVALTAPVAVPLVTGVFSPLTAAGAALLAGSCVASARRGGAVILPVIILMNTLFGLIHGFGFGFAGALAARGVVDERNLMNVLVGFNLGVEAGQIAFAGVLLALVWSGRRAMRAAGAAPDAERALMFKRLVAVLAAALAAYWMVGRSL